MQEHNGMAGKKTIQILFKVNKQIIDWVDDVVKDQRGIFRGKTIFLRFLNPEG